MIRYLDARVRDWAADPERSALPERQPAPPPVSDREERQPEVPRQMLGDPSAGTRPQAGRGMARWGRHRLAADSVNALRVTGIFGTVDYADAAELFCSERRARRSLQELERLGLSRIERFRRGQQVIEAVTLTRQGKRLLERAVDPRERADEEAQAYLAGPARSAQVLHDTAVYRAAREEMRRIEADGRLVRRIRTEQQLQRLAARSMRAAKRSGADNPAARSAAATALDLTVRDGKLSFPDARIEWEQAARGPSGSGWVDVEVATQDYRQSSLRAKAAAGFCVYYMDANGNVSRQAGGHPR